MVALILFVVTVIIDVDNFVVNGLAAVAIRGSGDSQHGVIT
jgi:hypothetical protein